jgi:hypothetical protein
MQMLLLAEGSTTTVAIKYKYIFTCPRETALQIGWLESADGSQPHPTKSWTISNDPTDVAMYSAAELLYK